MPITDPHGKDDEGEWNKKKKVCDSGHMVETRWLRQ